MVSSENCRHPHRPIQDGVKGAFFPQQIHAHLRENNPEHAKANIAVQPPTALGTQGFSSAYHTHLPKSVGSLADWEA